MRTKIKQILKAADPKSLIGQEHTVKGWVKTLRTQKSITFIEINDGSCFANIQVVVDSTEHAKTLAKVTTGASVAVTGVIAESPGKQPIEVQVNTIKVLGTADSEEYPLQKKRHSFEFLRTIAHLRPRTNSLGAVTRVRNAVAFASHIFFQERGFFYLHTPIISAADCEGAGEAFKVTAFDLDNVPKMPDGSVDYSKDFFGGPSFLTVSGQLNAEAYACALSDVYTLGPTFRAEKSTTPRHLSEFWMIEPEMAFADLNDCIDCAKAYVKFITKYVLENCADDMAFFDQFIAPGIIDLLQKTVDTPFERTTYTYAVRVLQKSGKSFEFPVEWGKDIQTEHERFLTEEFFQKPVVITDYPRDIKAFYMKDNADGTTVAAMDILVPKIGEIVGGSQREDRLDVLESKIKEFGLDPKPYWWYLELRKYGSVPHSGFGAGFDRLLRMVTGLDNIRDVIPFPRYPGHADF
jgi:asparaginyl-tRNA synthetase